MKKEGDDAEAKTFRLNSVKHAKETHLPGGINEGLAKATGVNGDNLHSFEEMDDESSGSNRSSSSSRSRGSSDESPDKEGGQIERDEYIDDAEIAVAENNPNAKEVNVEQVVDANGNQRNVRLLDKQTMNELHTTLN